MRFGAMPAATGAPPRLHNGGPDFSPPMAAEIFGTAALFWVLIPVGLLGGALLVKLLDN
jgi:cytochrome b6-f complex subunit 7